MKDTPTNTTALRADAQKNFDKLISVAEIAFAEKGMQASLKDIAAQAHVGIGTLYRRFPDRAALLEAVYGKRIEALCTQAKLLMSLDDPAEALRSWLGEVITLLTAYRGLDDLLAEALRNEHSYLPSYHAELKAAGEKLLLRAQRSGTMRRDVTIDDVLTLTSAMSMTTQKAKVSKAAIDRLLSLVIDGLRADNRK